MTVGEANRIRACVDCGEPGALLLRTTRGENPGRNLRLCVACLRRDGWHGFGLVDRQPFLGEVPTDFIDGAWCFSAADGPEPSAVITYTDEPSPETGDAGWCWWAAGKMGCAPTYEGACIAAEEEIYRRLGDKAAVLQMGEKWNAAHPVGTAVRYWPVYPPIGGIQPVDTTTRSEAWSLGDGSVVVLVVGKTGGVHLSHIEVRHG